MVPVFLGGLRWEWWRRYKNDPSKRHPGDAEYAVSFWLLDVAREKNGDIVDNITVKFEQKENSLFGTAYFHGKGDAPFNAAVDAGIALAAFVTAAEGAGQGRGAGGSAGGASLTPMTMLRSYDWQFYHQQ